MKKIAVLGSTGSIGKQTLEVAAANPDKLQIKVLAAHVNDKLLEEPYLTEKSLGGSNIELPYQVPDNRYFCMGDHRSTSVDSRHKEVGCVSEEQIVGKIVFRVFPFGGFGKLK